VFIPTSALPTFRIIHVAISLAVIISGFIVLFGMISDKQLNRWTTFFLATIVLTSVTGFVFPVKGMTPGIISLIVLAAVIDADYACHLSDFWRRLYVIGAVFALYLNFVVLIVQSFRKVTALHASAPNQNELPFLAVQVVSMVPFLVLGTLAVESFRAESLRTAWSRWFLAGDRS
jgi:hypothetical protein